MDENGFALFLVIFFAVIGGFFIGLGVRAGTVRGVKPYYKPISSGAVAGNIVLGIMFVVVAMLTALAISTRVPAPKKYPPTSAYIFTSLSFDE